LQQLQSIYSRLSEGSGAVAFVQGEPGNGKSRLLEATISWARNSGFRVYLARCEQLEQTKTFGPLVEAFGAWPSSNEPDQAAIGRLLFPESGSNVQAQPGVQYRVVEASIDLRNWPPMVL
jgi:predicted ATPase